MFVLLDIADARPHPMKAGYTCTYINGWPPASGTGPTKHAAWEAMIKQSCDLMVEEYELYRGPLYEGHPALDAIIDACVNRKCTSMKEL